MAIELREALSTGTVDELRETRIAVGDLVPEILNEHRVTLLQVLTGSNDAIAQRLGIHFQQFDLCLQATPSRAQTFGVDKART